MNLSDKMAELDRTRGGWILCKDKDDEGNDTFWITVNMGPPQNHYVKTEEHRNVHRAFDEAIDLFKAHLSKCPCC